MKQLGNLAVVCARRPDVLLQLYQGRVSLYVGEGPERAVCTARWEDDAAISGMPAPLVAAVPRQASSISTSSAVKRIVRPHFSSLSNACVCSFQKAFSQAMPSPPRSAVSRINRSMFSSELICPKADAILSYSAFAYSSTRQPIQELEKRIFLGLI